MKNILRSFLVIAGMIVGSILGAQDKPLVFVESVNNTSENKSADMTAFPAAIMDRLVNSRKFDVCRTAADMKKLLAERTAANKDSRAYKIRMTVTQYSTISAEQVHQGKFVLQVEALVGAQIEFVDAKTGKVLESKKAQATRRQPYVSTATFTKVTHTFKEKVLAECIQDVSTQCADRFLEMIYPVKIIKIQGDAVWINAGQDRAVAGEFFNVYRLGEALIDPDTGENLGSDEEFICQVKVEQAKQKFSIANVVSGSAPTGDNKQYILRKCVTEQAAPAEEAESGSPIPGQDKANPF